MSFKVNTVFLPEACSQQLECRVVHTIPGRIRIHIPQLLRDTEYNIRLKKLVELLDFVTNVRINSAADSLIVNYTETTLSLAALQPKLATAIQQATHPDIPVPGQLGQAISAPLTLYEQSQLQEIKKWESKETDFFSNVAGKIFSFINKLLDVIIPSAALQVALKAAETVTSQWQKDWEKLKPIAGVEDCHQLKQAQLEFCDQLAGNVENEAVMLAGTEGAITGFFEWVGEIADIPLSIELSLQTIHTIGLCYGYSPQTQTEKQFAWAILGIGTANTTEERRKALEALHDLQQVLYRQTIDDTIENSVEESLLEETMDSIVKQTIANLTGEYSGQALPILGIGLGVVVNCSVISEVSVSARRVFQKRWLLENKKIPLR